MRFVQGEYLALLQREQSFQNDNAIECYVKSHPKFSYGQVKFSDFSKKIQSEPLKRRLLSAGPAALLTAIKTVYAAAIALITLAKDIKCKKTATKMRLYTFVRNLEELTGWMVRIIHGPYSAFLIQRAKFHQACYLHVLKNKSPAPQKNSHAKKVKNSQKLKAHSLLKNGKRQEAFDEAKKPGGDPHIKESLMAEIARDYIKEDELEQALVVVNEIMIDTDVKEEIIAEVARGYTQREEFKHATTTTKAIKFDLTVKDSLFCEIAEGYLSLKEYLKAFEISKHIGDEAKQESLFEKLLPKAFAQRNVTFLKLILKEIYTSTLLKISIADQNDDKYTNFSTNHKTSFDKCIQQVVDKTYPTLVPLLKSNQASSVIAAMKACGQLSYKDFKKIMLKASQ